MDIKLLLAYDFSQEIKDLFSEYINMTLENNSDFKKYLKIQNYDDELKNLKSKYGLPYGRLYLAYYNGEVAGCIGLRKIDNSNCEMKRLFVRPQFRGKKVGEFLVNKIINDAKEIGYSHILLDTFPFFKSAINLYKKFSFYEIPSYNGNPMDSLIYMKLDL